MMPLFRGKKSSNKSPARTTPSTSSPSKRIHVRSELLNQLAKISDLFNKGYISEERYNKLQADVLEDMENF